MTEANPTGMFEQTVKNIDDILQKDAGCSSELDCVQQLDHKRFLGLLVLKYNALTDASEHLGILEMIRYTFLSFQKHLYVVGAA